MKQSKITTQAPDFHLDYLIDSNVQGVNILFVLWSENSTDRTMPKIYYLPTVEIENYNFMIYGQNFFNQPVKKN